MADTHASPPTPAERPAEAAAAAGLEARRLALRHRLYRDLLLLTSLLLLSLGMPWSLRRLTAGIGGSLLNLVLTVELGGGLRPRRRRLRTDRIYIALGLVTVIAQLLWFFTELGQRRIGVPLLLLVGSFSTWSLLRLVGDLSQERQVNGRVLMGAVAGYLFMGLTGGLMVTAMESVLPGSFRGAGDQGLLHLPPGIESLQDRQGWDDVFVRLVYFAFVALSTLGLGDILPQSRPAMVLTTAFTVIGPLYMAVVMGVLISRFTLQNSGGERS